MATNLENLIARKADRIAELAAIDATKAGGKPNVRGDGVGVDHDSYRQGIVDEIAKLNVLISQEDGAWEVRSQGVV